MTKTFLTLLTFFLIGTVTHAVSQEISGYPVSVVGESFANADGVSRQEIIANLKSGDTAWFVPEPENPRDEYAMAIFTDKGQIGYMKRGSPLRNMVRKKLENGEKLTAHILNTYMTDVGLYGVVVELDK